MKETKPWYISKVFLTGLAIAILGFWDQVQPFIPPDVLQKAAGPIGIILMVLRFFTNKPLAGGKQ